MLDPEIQAVLDQMNAARAGCIPAHEVPVAEARAAHQAETVVRCGPGEPVAEVRDEFVVGPGGDVLVRVFVPETAHGVVAYIHGGGWMMGTVASYDAPLRRLANTSGAVVAAVEYRLSPEHAFPAALGDCLAAIRWLAVSSAAREAVDAVGDALRAGLGAKGPAVG